jgi:molybdopterin converting factor small subunit
MFMEKEFILVKVKAFASLKDFWIDGDLEIHLPKGADAKFILTEVEKKLVLNSSFDPAEKLRLASILSESVLASESRILKIDDKLYDSCDLAVLPPVCGG